MDKKVGMPKRGMSGLPTIGEKQIPVQEIVDSIAAQLKPTMNTILNNIEGLERRLEIAEEVRKIFPDKVEVVIKHEQPQVISKDVVDLVVHKVMGKMYDKQAVGKKEEKK